MDSFAGKAQPCDELVVLNRLEERALGRTKEVLVKVEDDFFLESDGIGVGSVIGGLVGGHLGWAWGFLWGQW